MIVHDDGFIYILLKKEEAFGARKEEQHTQQENYVNFKFPLVLLCFYSFIHPSATAAEEKLCG